MGRRTLFLKENYLNDKEVLQRYNPSRLEDKLKRVLYKHSMMNERNQRAFFMNDRNDREVLEKCVALQDYVIDERKRDLKGL